MKRITVTITTDKSVNVKIQPVDPIGDLLDCIQDKTNKVKKKTINGSQKIILKTEVKPNETNNRM